MKKIVVVGGGVGGLVISYLLSLKKYKVTLIEKNKYLGGLASGFKEKKWLWYLDKQYHHIFNSDKDFFTFCKEIGFNDIFFKKPESYSFFSDKKMYKFDSPQDLFFFPKINFIEKIRFGVFVLVLKISPFISFFEKKTSKKISKSFLGKNSWFVLWEELFRKKFGKYAENILASFFWARIKVRSNKLWYVKGGFQNFVNFLEKKCLKNKVRIVKKTNIYSVLNKKNGVEVNGILYDKCILTVSSKIISKIVKNKSKDIRNLGEINYLNSQVLIFILNKKIKTKAYWINVLDKNNPIMVSVLHTNFIDSKKYNNSEILYIGNYLEKTNKLFKLSKKELVSYYLKYLQEIFPDFDKKNIKKTYLFREEDSQPIFDKIFIKNKISRFNTLLKNIYISNLDSTYPNDRGVNYAIKKAKELLIGF